MQIQKNLFLFLFLLFFLNSCSKAPDSKTILNSFPQLSYVSESQNIHLSIYLDDSESMRGFVTNPQSTYCLETGNFIQRVLETTISSYDIFTISSLRQQQFSSRTIRDPSLYNAISTPLDQTLHHIVNQVKNDSTTEHISIIVSDLVLSNDRDITNFTKQLKELSKISPEFLLIGFQSIFQGKYFSEYPIKGTLQVQNQTRPFYFLINTRTKKTLQLVKEKLLSTQNANVFEASAPVLMIDSI
ncbi:MAG: hypothetical protein N2450_01020, partial [bacterium]|nr:hypothetical protein [bacterium]